MDHIQSKMAGSASFGHIQSFKSSFIEPPLSFRLFAQGRHVDDLVQSGGTNARFSKIQLIKKYNSNSHFVHNSPLVLVPLQKVLAAHGASGISACDPTEGLSYLWITDSCGLTVKEVMNKPPFEVLSLASSMHSFCSSSLSFHGASIHSVNKYFLGLGQFELGGLSYFAGAEKKDESVLVPDLGSLTSIYDRGMRS
ncbi:hypothetical protein YC2023_100592 [Brassica napus]